jgi:hypothetical protein
MTDEERVQEIYPGIRISKGETILKGCYGFFESTFLFSVCAQSEEEAWKRAWDVLQDKMLERLSQ